MCQFGHFNRIWEENGNKQLQPNSATVNLSRDVWLQLVEQPHNIIMWKLYMQMMMPVSTTG